MPFATRIFIGSLLLCCLGSARAALVAEPGQLVFTPAIVGQSQTLAVTLTNTGNTPLNVVGLSPVFDEFAYSGGSCGAVPFALAAQANCTLDYTFTPTIVWKSTQSVSAIPDVGNVVEFMLVGRGVSGALQASPAQLTFPLQALGSTAGPLAVTLNNITGAPVTVVSLTPASGPYADAGGTCGTVPFTVAALGNCTLGYTFTPTSVGMFYRTVTATPNVGGSLDFGLAGEGDVGRLIVEPRSIDFTPAIPVGAFSEERFATLENIGRVPLEVLAIGPFVPPAVISFVRTGGTCPEPPFPMLASGTCTVGFTFVPAAVGEVELDMQFENNVASAETVTLRGEGLPGDDFIFVDGFDGN